MEISTEIEQETTMEVENCNEITQEEVHAEMTHLHTKQTERQYQENMDDEQSEVQEEAVVTRLNLKQQIDVQKLILDESKNYINIEERGRIMKTAMEQKTVKLQELIRLLKQKIKDEKNAQRRTEMEANKEERKLLEIRNFTESTMGIVDTLKNYVEGFEQQIEKLKLEELQKKVIQKYKESLRMINEKTASLKKVKKEISNLKPEFNVKKEKLINELQSKQISLNSEQECLKKKLVTLQQENRQLKDEISKIDNDLRNKEEDELKNSGKLKEFLNSKMEELNKFKLNCLKLQELESERNRLVKCIENASSSIDVLKNDIEKLVEENSTLETELISNKDTTIEENMEEIPIIELEKEMQDLKEDLQNIEKQQVETQKYIDELLISNHEKEVMLLKKQNLLTCPGQQLLGYKNSNDKDTKKIEKLKVELNEVKEQVERKRKTIESVEKEVTTLKNNKSNIESALEKYQQEIKDKNDQLNYQRNTLQVHLEDKLKGLEKKLEEVEKNKDEEKENFIKMEAVNKKKNEQYNRLRQVYMMLKTSSSSGFKFSESIRKQPIEDNKEDKDIVEAEPTSAETSPKSILKSPGVTRPSTPTKKVKFVGLPSIASSNSSEMVNAQPMENPDPFDELKNSVVPKGRNRNFD